MTTENNDEQGRIILVLGETGAGKSYLIKEASGADVVIGHELESCTQKAKGFKCKILGQTVFLIDTPGFDDTYRTDADILSEITDMLCDLYKIANSKICGLIYIHKISETRMKRSAMKNIKLFKSLCGDSNFSNVVLLTNRWDTVDYQTGLQREQELINNYWKLMIGLGCKVERYTNKQEDITRIFNYLLQKEEVVLDIQRQMVDEGRALDETSAGDIINEDIIKAKAECNSEIQMYKEMIEELRRSNSKLIEDARNERSQFLDKINKLENDLNAMAKKYEPKPSLIKRVINGIGMAFNIRTVLKALGMMS